MGCLSPPAGIFFLCGFHAYTCLPANWMGICKLVFLIPLSSTLSTQKSLLSLLSALYAQKEMLASPPLVLGLGLLTRIGTGLAKLEVSISQFQKL
jgi:hypothetical protein